MSSLIESKRLHYTTNAYQMIRAAAEMLKLCGAVDAAARVQSTLDSVRGAVRHAQSLAYLGDEDLAQRRRRRRPKKTAKELARQFDPKTGRRYATKAEMRQAGRYR